MKNQFQVTEGMREKAKMLFDIWCTLEGNAKAFDPLTDGDHIVTVTKAVERNSASGNPMKEIKWQDVTTGQSAITYTLRKRFAEFAKMKDVQEGETYLISHKKNKGFSNVNIKRKLPPQVAAVPKEPTSNRSLFMYDIEIFMKYNLFVAFDIFLEQWVVIDNIEELRQFYLQNRDSLFGGYNNVGYDAKVTRAWLQGRNTHALSQLIVKGHNNFKAIGKMFDNNKTPFFQIDMYQDNRGWSLKEHEAFQGLDIRESSVSFEYEGELTDEQKLEVIQYCKHDVTATLLRFYQNIDMLLAKVVICAKFGLSKQDIALTNANLTAKILGAIKQEHGDATAPFELPDNISIEHKEVLEMFTGREFELDEDGKVKLDLTIEEQEGLETVFGSGGIHAAIPKTIYIGKFNWRDVGSLYPNVMILFMLLSRNIPEDKLHLYEDLLKERMAAKYSKEKTYTINGVTIPLKVLVDGIKLPLNTKYGAEGAEFNQLYDPRNRLWVCIVGQLVMFDLFEKIKPHAKVLQSNTDAHAFIPNSPEDAQAIEEIANDWQKRTGLILDNDPFNALYQKDVNNYLAVDADGKVKMKGAIGLTHGMKISKAIISNAFINHVVSGYSYKDYIYECQDLRQFQIIAKTGSKFAETIQINAEGVESPAQRVNRVYAVKDATRAVELFKVKYLDKGKDKEKQEVVDEVLDEVLNKMDNEPELDEFEQEAEEKVIIQDDRSLTSGVPRAPEYYAVDNVAVGQGIQIDEIDKEYYIDEVEHLLKLWFGANYEEDLAKAHESYKEQFGELPPVKEYITGQ